MDKAEITADIKKVIKVHASESTHVCEIKSIVAGWPAQHRGRQPWPP